MTTASDGVAVVATQLARTDRRALSQAWYSALHLAHDRHPLASVAHHSARAASVSPERHVRSSEQRVKHAAALPSRSHGERAIRNAVPAVPERRLPVSEATARIERALSTLTVPAREHAAQTIDLAGGRVRLLVRTERGTTRVVALCSDALRDHVERALARARFALAAYAGTGSAR